MRADFLKEFEFFTGVPDSQLKALCDYLMDTFGTDPKHHIIAANEGNCAAIAAGYHLATGKVPVVYLQNSGEGNIINPVASLMNDKVYAIPCLFVVGWRGEPGVHDEPQHLYQGEVTLKLLEDMDIACFVIDKSTSEEQVSAQLKEWQPLFEQGKQAAFVVKGALEYEHKVKYQNDCSLVREEIIRRIVEASGEDMIVSTTGKASRELFEIREANAQPHGYDFLTVGSMGHSSSIALGVAIHKPKKKIWCIDGDGAVLMHMGAMAVVGAKKPPNLVHILINNGAHETVGGIPTVAGSVNITEIARACGYEYVACAETYDELEAQLKILKEKNKLSFLEVKCGIGARADLGRPTTTAKENKIHFMEQLQK